MTDILSYKTSAPLKQREPTMASVKGSLVKRHHPEATVEIQYSSVTVEVK